MDIIFENTKTQQRVTTVLDDAFYTEAKDIMITIGMEQFKLTSTKSKDDVLREKLAIDFGEEYYDALYKIYPDFGVSGSKVDPNTIKEIIKGKLTINPKYEPLLKDKQPEVLIKCLITAFSNYCTVRRKMEEEDKAIKDSQIRENVFYDYIFRYKKLFGTESEAKTIKNIFEGIYQINQYAQIDKRELYGYGRIFQCLGPFFKWTNTVQNEIHEIDKNKSLQDHPLYTDEQYLLKNRNVLDNVCDLLDSLDLEFETYQENIKELMKKDPDSNPFKFFADIFINWYMSFITAKDNLEKELRKQLEDQLCDVKGVSDQFSKVYHEFLTTMTNTRIKFELDPRTWKAAADRTVISSQFAMIDYWNQEVNKASKPERGQKIDMFARNLCAHVNVLRKIINGDINSADLLAGKYKEETLIKSENK